MSEKGANKMNQIRGIVIATLLTVWSFPAVSSARTPPAPAPQIEQIAAVTNGRPAGPADAETSGLAAREAQARELQGFRGGSGVYIYVGSGALVVVLVVLLILLVV